MHERTTHDHALKLKRPRSPTVAKRTSFAQCSLSRLHHKGQAAQCRENKFLAPPELANNHAANTLAIDGDGFTDREGREGRGGRSHTREGGAEEQQQQQQQIEKTA